MRAAGDSPAAEAAARRGWEEGDCFQSPSGDYIRTVRIELFTTNHVHVVNVATGRRSKMLPDTLARWTKVLQ